MPSEMSPLFDEVIQLATPDCIKRRDMTLVRKLKELQNYTQRLERIADDAMNVLNQNK